ncbi:hypothetical protein [Roseobacter sp. CCS2]|uniref:hypothetical protein n=1 Tax=Roseobacter sp. CCS2 TaxID=391593 RepID=UPI0000F3F761|nr:hypothetical protein [Roseobacter sp. CCS2]EBA10594.1 hypothetical protein RCCS2_03052 [Roseobacter sp. CCS2]
MNTRTTPSLFEARDDHQDAVAHYLRLTRQVLPQLARQHGAQWPVKHDHCFQRIVLDTICGGVWYDYLARPAYKHINQQQARRAVQLCEDIIAKRVDIHALNQQSLIWRGKV